ncbi:unnamed protein product [Dicrocoelium dendriticum]|nr:unnamed protein product [Dicrocoelium dendriticum]
MTTDETFAHNGITLSEQANATKAILEWLIAKELQLSRNAFWNQNILQWPNDTSSLGERLSLCMNNELANLLGSFGQWMYCMNPSTWFFNSIEAAHPRTHDTKTENCSTRAVDQPSSCRSRDSPQMGPCDMTMQKICAARTHESETMGHEFPNHLLNCLPKLVNTSSSEDSRVWHHDIKADAKMKTGIRFSSKLLKAPNRKHMDGTQYVGKRRNFGFRNTGEFVIVH